MMPPDKEIGMSLKIALFPVLAVAALFAAAPAAHAFSVESAPVNPDGSARFVDPDQQTDQISQHYQDTRDNQANWYGNDSQYQSSFGARPRDDHSYWGSSMLETPQR